MMGRGGALMGEEARGIMFDPGCNQLSGKSSTIALLRSSTSLPFTVTCLPFTRSTCQARGGCVRCATRLSMALV